jgi:ABC-type uncharacterized transport system substrate-binding protein
MHNPDRRRFIRTTSALGIGSLLATAGLRAAPRPHVRILHVMSFDSPWRWTDGQLAGFRQGLDLPSAEFRILQMDVKRNTTPEAKAARGREAREVIDRWRPDLVYTSDDDAIEHVARHYAGSDIPFVFSGVNKSPAAHGIDGASNITGVLEQEHFVESVRLLRQISPDVGRLAVISDLGIQWPPVIERIRARTTEVPDIELVSVAQFESFSEFQAHYLDVQTRADAMVQLGIFTLRGSDGGNVPYQQVQQWVVENTRLPDISFWIDRVFHGVLASVTVSEQQQGFGAGRLARRILVDGASPGALPIRPSVKGHPAINLTRAEQLGLRVRSSQLLSSEVVRGFQWAPS